MNKESKITVRFYKLNASKYTALLGLNLYHSAIEFDDVEYCFEGVVKEINPKSYRNTLMSSNTDSIITKEFIVGACRRELFYSVLNKLKLNFTESDYNMISCNCNHFIFELLKHLFIELSHLTLESMFSKLYIITGNFWELDAFNKLITNYFLKLEQHKNDNLRQRPQNRLRVINTTCSTINNSELRSRDFDSEEVVQEESLKSKILSLKKFVPRHSLSLRISASAILSLKLD